ncbi:MAG: HAMP domain-containing histidine kinase [Bacteroidales bacterium]|nr:HAMP domain-containing histidine kinase [Bacteroidales bacterium]
MNILKESFRIRFAIVFFLLVTYMVYTSFINYSISKGILHYGFSRHITNIENQIVSFQKNSPPHFSDEIVALNFRNDSLISWTYNQFPKNVNRLIKDTNITLVYDTTGIFLSKLIQYDSFSVIYLSKLLSQYPYENEFLKRSFTWKPDLMKGCQIKSTKSNYPIKDSKSRVLGYLHFGKNFYSNSQFTILYILYLTLFVSILSVLLRLLKTKFFKRYQRIYLLAFMSILYLLFVSNFSFSSIKYHQVFQPTSFVLTNFFPSVNSFLTFLIVLITFVLFEVGKTPQSYSRFSRVFWALIVAFLPVGLLLIIPSLVVNSASFIQWNDFSTINLTSLLMYSIISLLIILLVILTNHSVNTVGYKSRYYILFSGVFLTLFLLLATDSLFLVLLLALFYAVTYAYIRQFWFKTISFTITSILIFSLAVNSSINRNLAEKELDKRKILIQTLALNQDPEVEYLFSVIENKIYNDSVFVQLLDSNWYNNEAVQSYLNDTYFSKSSHWKRYDFQFTTCNEVTNLILKPQNEEISCYKFFYNNLISKGTLTSSKNLYRMEYGSGQINYLGIFRFMLTPDSDSISEAVTVYTEINSKIKRKGFTKLLSPSGLDPFERIRDYSLARYNYGTLLENYGDFAYPSEIQDSMAVGTMVNLNFNNYSHLLYRPTISSAYVLSRPIPKELQSVSGFASIFIFIFLIFLFLYIFFDNYLIKNRIPQTFSFRLQTNIILILSTSLLLVAFVSAYYIRQLSLEKDTKSHTKTAYSLRTEFEQKLSKSQVEKSKFKDYLYELSLKFSGVFSTDINLYDLNGQLIVTTRPELFSNRLLSDYMNPDALKEIRSNKQTFISKNEKIGRLNFLSAYMPFHDADGEVVAFLHLPYIAQQDLLSKEISGFVMTVVNVYMLIIVISTLMILLFSNYIIRPLRMISEKMKRISFGGKNEKIEWNRKDEFGDLVAEYNRMVDQIGQSAVLLARAERESAWQQMARQVAHEIKNPLTPMKLSVQYLQKALEDNEPGWKERLKNLSSNLVEQIDTLASIATAFSDFAKMPVGEMEKMDLISVINASVEIFKDYDHITFSFDFSATEIWVLGDRKNLLRVFNNLIKNSIQSIDYQDKGLISISVQSEDEQCKVSVTDNGCGISEELKSRIFQPDFTTKSGGMGLGLAMVRNIILQHGGTIDFISESNKGTTFYFYLNLVNHE